MNDSIPRVITEFDVVPVKTYPVRFTCRVCVGSWRKHEFEHGWIFNKASGALHLQSLDGYEYTHCGKDATGKTWLWQQ